MPWCLKSNNTCHTNTCCIASFSTYPEKSARYGCGKDINIHECKNFTHAKVIQRCCVKDYCNMPSLIEQYFPTTLSKYI